MKIYETDEVFKYLKKRKNLIKQYLKVKRYFEEGHTQMIDLKLLKPKKDRFYQIKINNKFRAIGYYKEDGFLVFHISDHQ